MLAVGPRAFNIWRLASTYMQPYALSGQRCHWCFRSYCCRVRWHIGFEYAVSWSAVVGKQSVDSEDSRLSVDDTLKPTCFSNLLCTLQNIRTALASEIQSLQIHEQHAHGKGLPAAQYIFGTTSTNHIERTIYIYSAIHLFLRIPVESLFGV